jgi:hypothetical protein
VIRNLEKTSNLLLPDPPNPKWAKLLMDYDFRSEENLLKFISRIWPFIWRFEWHFGRLQLHEVEIRKTEHGWHFYVTLQQQLKPEDIAYLQLALGSDYKRECFNWRRVRLKLFKDWNVLYREKFDERDRLVSKEGERLTELENEVRRIIDEARKVILQRAQNQVENSSASSTGK